MTEPLTPEQIAAAMNAQQAPPDAPISIELDVQTIAVGVIDGVKAVRVTVTPGLVDVTFKLTDPVRRKLHTALGDLVVPG